MWTELPQTLRVQDPQQLQRGEEETAVQRLPAGRHSVRRSSALYRVHSNATGRGGFHRHSPLPVFTSVTVKLCSQDSHQRVIIGCDECELSSPGFPFTARTIYTLLKEETGFDWSCDRTTELFLFLADDGSRALFGRNQRVARSCSQIPFRAPSGRLIALSRSAP